MNIRKPAKIWGIFSYRHLTPWPKGNLYHEVRRRRGLSLRKMADSFGISWASYRYRETHKRMYHLAEICALHEASGLTARQFFNIMREIA